MGQSIDAILVYGVDLGEDEVPESLVFNDEDDGGDTEESKPLAYALYMGRSLPSGVTLVSHCSDSCTMRILAIEASEFRAWRGYAKEVPALVVDPAWDRRALGNDRVSALTIADLRVLALSIICGKPPEPKLSWSTAGNLSYFATHALLLSGLSFAAVVCLKNYRAARHNEIMNAHRARALSTFEDFRAGSEGRVLDVILLQPTSAIFSMQPSGFGDTDTTGVTHLHELAATLGVKKDRPNSERAWPVIGPRMWPAC